MNFIQGTLQALEIGKGAVLVRIVPLVITLAAIIVLTDFGSLNLQVLNLGGIYHGLNDPQSMDNAQLARQIARGKGFTTEFLRPHAISQMQDFLVNQGLTGGKTVDLFPRDQYPPGKPRVLPDTYNAPGFPYVLAAWFSLTHPEFDQSVASIGNSSMYSPDRFIPLLNQIFMLLTGMLVFILGARLFDQRVAWMGLVTFLFNDLVWRYTLTALGTSMVMLLTTIVVWCIVEIITLGEECFDREERSFAPAWIWGLILTLALAAIFLTRLQFIILVVPVVVALILMPASSVLLTIFVGLLSVAAVVPWFFHLYAVCGSFLGSNAPEMLRGSPGYEGNQIYCTTTIPSYEQVFRDFVRLEYSGFRWNFEHAWSLLGSNPMVLFFGASILHQFKRRRTRMLHWFLFGSVVAVLLSSNLSEAKPDAVDIGNAMVILLPGMIVIGCAFFFILLDRLALQLWLLNNLVVILALLLTAMPLAMSLTTPGPYPFAWPPYWPYSIRMISQMAQPDEWVTTDIPWATAWYGDRASLWLPDSVTDFESFHDNVCPTGMMLFTPQTWDAPMSNVMTGEYKEWFGLMTVGALPNNFPLTEHYAMQGKIPGYVFWSDRPRWMLK